MAGEVIPLFKREEQPEECSDDEKIGPLTHDQINHIHVLTGLLAETNDADTVVELMARIRQEVDGWP